MKKILLQLFINIDSKLKFPNLRKGETGIQVGFDLSSKSLTTDVLKMNRRTGNEGLVIAVDPDPFNHEKLRSVVEKKGLNVQLVQKGTYSEKTTDKLELGFNSSHNKISSVELETTHVHSGEKIEVELDTLDNIVRELGLDYSKIRHISITNNGAEYDTLLGMEEIFEKCPNLNLTIASGRQGKNGELLGKRDFEVIMPYLREKGFKCRLLRINKSFWWGFVNFLLIKRKWKFSRKQFGVIMASRGSRGIKWYQSFS